MHRFHYLKKKNVFTINILNLSRSTLASHSTSWMEIDLSDIFFQY